MKSYLELNRFENCFEYLAKTQIGVSSVEGLSLDDGFIAFAFV